jgi:hypothetical protein
MVINTESKRDFCILCSQCCQCLWIVYSWLPIRFSLTFIYMVLLFEQVYLITCHVFRCMLWCPLRCSVSLCSYLMFWLYFCWYLRILMSNTIIVIIWFSCLTVIRRMSLVEQPFRSKLSSTPIYAGLVLFNLMLCV